MDYLESMFSLKGKVAIVSGATRGNGLSIAEGLNSAGAFVYFVDLVPLKLNNPNTFFIHTDITKEADLKKLIQTVDTRSGQIDILVNNAGITQSGLAEDYTLEDWDNTLKVNLRAAFRLSQLVAQQMIRHKNGGTIINIASLGAHFGFPGNPAYVASKSAILGLTKALAEDWAKYNIRVNSVTPGYIHTRMTEKAFKNSKLHQARLDRMMLKRWGRPEDLAGTVIFLSSDASTYITGIDIPVDGGWTAKGL